MIVSLTHKAVCGRNGARLLTWPWPSKDDAEWDLNLKSHNCLTMLWLTYVIYLCNTLFGIGMDNMWILKIFIHFCFTHSILRDFQMLYPLFIVMRQKLQMCSRMELLVFFIPWITHTKCRYSFFFFYLSIHIFSLLWVTVSYGCGLIHWYHSPSHRS